MPSDITSYQEALKRGSAYAWNGQWDRAVEQYLHALEQSPDDIPARNHLAMAYFRSGQMADALELYQGLWKVQPSNLGMLQRVAELQEALGDRASAAAAYRVLAEIHGRKQANREALKAWRRVVELEPDNPVFWNSLMDLAARNHTVSEVMPDYLGFARSLALRGRFQEAVQVAEHAQVLDPMNPLVLPLLTSIRRGLEYSWRSNSLGDEAGAEDLARLIPPIQPPDRFQEETPPTRPSGPRPQVREAAPVQEAAAAQPPEAAPAAEEVRPSQPEGPDMPGEPPVLQAPAPPVDALPLGPAMTEAPPPDLEAEQRVEDAPVGLALAPSEYVPPEMECREPAAAKVGTTGLQETDKSLDGRKPEAEKSWEVGEPTHSNGATAGVALEAQSDVAATEPEAQPDVAAVEPSEVVEPQPVPEPEPWDVPEPEIPLREEGEVVEPSPGLEMAVALELEEPTGGQLAPLTWEAGIVQPPEVEPEAAEQDEPPLESRAGEGDEPSLELQVGEGDQPEEQEPALDSWEALVRQAQEARGSGRLEEAIDLYERSLAAGTAIAEQFVELAEAHEQLGQLEQAFDAYRQALELAPELPHALLGMAHLHFSAGRLGDAEEKAHRALESRTVGKGEIGPSASELLTDIHREQAARGDLQSVVQGLAWLRSILADVRLESSTLEKMATVSRELLGPTVGEHLDEVMQLPSDLRHQVVLSLREAEAQLEAGRWRWATDRVSSIVGSHPGFLPAQSLLGRVLLAQGRIEEARERARQLVKLYQLREQPSQALEILWWAVAQAEADGDASAQLMELLLTQGRAHDAEFIDAGQWKSPSSGVDVSEPDSPLDAGEAWESCVFEPPMPEDEPAADEELAGQPAAEMDLGAMERLRLLLRSEEPPQPMESAPIGGPPASGELPDAEAQLRSQESAGSEEELARGNLQPRQPASELHGPSEPRGGLPLDDGAPPSEAMAGPDLPGPANSAGPEFPREIVEVADSRWSDLLGLAEIRFALGDRSGAERLLVSALEADGEADDVTRAAFWRVLQASRLGDHGRQELAEILRRLGLPEGLVGR